MERRALWLLCVFVLNCFTFSISGIISSSGLLRKNLGQTCTFQWTLNEPITNYTLYRQATAISQTPLSSNANYTYTTDKGIGVITLNITNVQLYYAGNYSLVVTTATSTYNDSTACLFVYGYAQGTVKITSGPVPTREGDTLEVTCNLTSSSLPATYRSAIYYSWYTINYGPLKNITSGQAVLPNGDIVPRYTIQNNGRTLVISSVRFPDDQYVYCLGLEGGSSGGWNYNYFPLQLLYRPYFSGFNPASQKFNAITGTPVTLAFSASSNPVSSFSTNWTFTDSAGISQELPSDSLANYNTNNPSLQFNFTSVQHYGTYSITLSNSIGSTTATFQVLPEGPPDALSNVRLQYVAHSSLAVQWNLMWSNTIAHQQTVSTRLILSDSNSEVQTLSYSFFSESFNSTYAIPFNTNIQPDTNYKVSVWSVNSFGSSEVVALQTNIRTRSKQPKLIVLPETISINGSQLMVNFTVKLEENMENVTQANAVCCSEFSGQCSNYNFYYPNNPDVINGIPNYQIVMNNIPNGTVYYIDITIYSGIYVKYIYYADIIKGIRVSRAEEPILTNSEAGSDNSSLLVAVIVLAVFLGVSLIVLTVILIVFLVRRFRHQCQPNKPPQIPFGSQLNMTPRAHNAERPQSTASDFYEPLDMEAARGQHFYTGFDASSSELK